MGGGGGGGGPTLQQQQLETEQALTTANLNLEENSQRKSILNAMSGTRVFRGSALSRAVAGNNDAGPPVGAPSKAQTSASAVPSTIAPVSKSLLDARAGSGSTPSGGTGASGNAAELAAAQASNASAMQAAYAAAFGAR